MYGSPCRTGGNRACKAKAQSGALLRVGGAVVPFCLESGWRVSKKKDQTEFVDKEVVATQTENQMKGQE